MSLEPEFGTTTERLYDRLPGLYREADETHDHALKRYAALTVDQAADVEDLFDRIDYRDLAEGGAVGDTSDLVDPDTADGLWLPWLAQLVGVRASEDTGEATSADWGDVSDEWATWADLEAEGMTWGQLAELTIDTPDVGPADLRDAIRARAGWLAGSSGAIRERVAPLLTGTQRVDVFSHAGGDRWAVEVRTYADETPRPWQVARALGLPGVKPAGVLMSAVVAAGQSWGQLVAAHADWAEVQATYADWAEVVATIPTTPEES